MTEIKECARCMHMSWSRILSRAHDGLWLTEQTALPYKGYKPGMPCLSDKLLVQLGQYLGFLQNYLGAQLDKIVSAANKVMDVYAARNLKAMLNIKSGEAGSAHNALQEKGVYKKECCDKGEDKCLDDLMERGREIAHDTMAEMNRMAETWQKPLPGGGPMPSVNYKVLVLAELVLILLTVAWKQLVSLPQAVSTVLPNLTSFYLAIEDMARGIVEKSELQSGNPQRDAMALAPIAQKQITALLNAVKNV